MSRRGFAVITIAVGLAACSLDWDSLDPRVSGAVGGDAAIGGAVGIGGRGTGGQGGMGGSGGEPTAGGGTPTGTGGGDPWYDRGLTTRRPITVSATMAGVSDFPLLVALDADIAASVADPTTVRVVASDHATLLAHEIDHWATGGAALWVRVPSLENTTLWLYHGPSPSEDALDPIAVWADAHAMVHHLDGLENSAGASLDGTGTNTTTATGRIGAGLAFAGTGDVALGLEPVLDDLFHDGGSITTWVNAATSGEVQRGRILDRSLSTGFGSGWGLLMSDFAQTDSYGFGFSYATAFGWWTTPMGSVTYGSWQHVAVTFDLSDGAPKLYIDGQEVTATVSEVPAGAPYTPSPVQARIGNAASSSTRGFDGVLDEIRVSTTVRSAAWIAAEAAGESLATVGDAQTGP